MSNYYFIKSKLNGNVIDIQGGSTTSGALLDAYPQIRAILKPVFAGLDLATLRGLNERIAVAAEDPKAVARDYLKRQGSLN